MNKYFATRTIDRSCNVGDSRTVIYCDNNPESIETVYKLFCDATPITRKNAMALVRWERNRHRINYADTPPISIRIGGIWGRLSMKSIARAVSL